MIGTEMYALNMFQDQKILYRFFKHARAVDAHNAIRQGDLNLEDMWPTGQAYFCFATEWIGITVMGIFYLQKQGRRKKITKFANRLSFDLIIKVGKCRTMKGFTRDTTSN